jgi:hypothetical protein
MNRTILKLTNMKYLILFFLIVQCVSAQGYDRPLLFQGVDHNTMSSAGSRAAGGMLFGMNNDIGLMFGNPAALQTITGPQISFGAVQQYSSANQNQQYAPLKYFSNFSLLMEGLTGSIQTPVYDTSNHGYNAGDTVQRPYDNFGPNWSHSRDRAVPLQGLVAVPVTIGDQKLAVGVGVVQYANLDNDYQNNNVLSPSILSVRPVPIGLPGQPGVPDSMRVAWSQFSRTRFGAIRGYGAALSGSVAENKIALGVSGMILRGTTDDFMQYTGRGSIMFYKNSFRVDSVYSHISQSGTSDYSGAEFTLSGVYRGKNLTLGFAIKPPTTITRSYTGQHQVDTGGSIVTSAISGEDKMKLPWRGTVGLSLAVKENLSIHMEYEFRPFESAVYTDAGGTTSSPWLSAAVLHAGLEYNPASWLVLRGGIRGQAEVFEPEGNQISGEPVSFSVYSAGAGILFAGVHVDLTYEYGFMKYQDVWGGAISFNTVMNHQFVAGLSYDIPWQD